ncbi:IS66 family insertion sequence element accessory protein TnpA [Paenibacillus periandrae]|uniref:IS66 family insertion sequence element accessory protein TnpA n=1 Tax=Paenibacillus periandrae TaxID=1761741 RepID=UPI001F099DB4|nr:IS66 family insertion sequence element accessory protein TnpB [Paenibacillus periandrae]
MDTNLQEVWTKRIIAYQTSGQTMKAWCAEQELTVHQLKYWLYKDQKQTQAGSATTFRPVAVARQSPTTESLQIQVGVARIDVRLGFEPGLLRDVVAALTPLC